MAGSTFILLEKTTMQPTVFFAKQERDATALRQWFTKLVQLQQIQQDNLLDSLSAHQQSTEAQLSAALSRWPTLEDWLSYAKDASQRQVLFWDTLRHRGDQLLHQEQKGFPLQLRYPHQQVLCGRNLPAPVNYSLHRMQALNDCPTVPDRPPIIIIDPRGGHGPGISGFRADSCISESLKAGHPTYFIAFEHSPEPGQRLEDVAQAQTYFVEYVVQQHPNVGKPIIIGNCQAGWAVMGIAAQRPELPGVIVINGTPLSYWAGSSGRNPMRYSGGLLGGAWLTRLGSDLGNGRFDGAWLAINFELLSPANTLWGKYYRLFQHVDTEATEFLDFERWWGTPVLFNREEIETIVDELFIGNCLVRKSQRPQQCLMPDLRRIQAPVVIFCSSKDNIAPPQQALQWVAELYPDTQSLKQAGRTIVYMEHNSAGHLELFLSAKVACREHRQIIALLESISTLPAGLYELIIDNDSDNPHLEPRNMTDILDKTSDTPDDQQEFRLVEQISTLNSTLYELTVRPWLQPLIQESAAHGLRQLHPFRVERYIWSSLNPALWWLPAAAEHTSEHRQTLAANNPLLLWQDLFATGVEQSLDFWRAWRDAGQELAFHSLYGGLAIWTGAQQQASDYIVAEAVAFSEPLEAASESPEPTSIESILPSIEAEPALLAAETAESSAPAITVEDTTLVESPESLQAVIVSSAEPAESELETPIFAEATVTVTEETLAPAQLALATEPSLLTEPQAQTEEPTAELKATVVTEVEPEPAKPEETKADTTPNLTAPSSEVESTKSAVPVDIPVAQVAPETKAAAPVARQKKPASRQPARKRANTLKTSRSSDEAPLASVPLEDAP